MNFAHAPDRAKLPAELAAWTDRTTAGKDVLNALDDIEHSQGTCGEGTTRWEALFNPQRLESRLVGSGAPCWSSKNSGWGGTLDTPADVPADLPVSSPTNGAMRQVLLNLLENAEFTLKGGSSTLRNLHRTSQWVQVSICDTALDPDEEQEGFSSTASGLPRPLPPHRDSGWVLSVCRRNTSHGGRSWVVSGSQARSLLSLHRPD